MATTDAAMPTMCAPDVVVDDFLPFETAEAMRRDIEAHFAKSGSHRPDTHQVWNYWFVPGLYTYLRTSPEKLINRDRVEHFMQVLRGWSAEALGLREVTWPYLSLYVSGCRQNLHNDSENGRFAFVYSLTRDKRMTTGGQTIVMNEGDLFRTNVSTAQAGCGLLCVDRTQFQQARSVRRSDAAWRRAGRWLDGSGGGAVRSAWASARQGSHRQRRID